VVLDKDSVLNDPSHSQMPIYFIYSAILLTD